MQSKSLNATNGITFILNVFSYYKQLIDAHDANISLKYRMRNDTRYGRTVYTSLCFGCLRANVLYTWKFIFGKIFWMYLFIYARCFCAHHSLALHFKLQANIISLWAQYNKNRRGTKTYNMCVCMFMYKYIYKWTNMR